MNDRKIMIKRYSKKIMLISTVLLAVFSFINMCFAAAQNNDLVEVADALGDMLYILCGTIIEHGMQYKIEEVFNEIQRSNMSKLGADGNPIYREDGKVLKGPSYFKPNIKEILDR